MFRAFINLEIYTKNKKNDHCVIQLYLKLVWSF